MLVSLKPPHPVPAPSVGGKKHTSSVSRSAPDPADAWRLRLCGSTLRAPVERADPQSEVLSCGARVLRAVHADGECGPVPQELEILRSGVSVWDRQAQAQLGDLDGVAQAVQVDSVRVSFQKPIPEVCWRGPLGENDGGTSPEAAHLREQHWAGRRGCPEERHALVQPFPSPGAVFGVHRH
eukprot:3939408-Rhodomonas_salina.2